MSEKSLEEGADFTGDANNRPREELAVCRRCGDEVRDKLLELYAWNFAKVTAAGIATTSCYGWKNAYRKPSDCLKVLAVLSDDEPVEWELSDNKILCDGSDAYVRYIRRVEEVDEWPAVFKEAYCYYLAVEVGLAIGVSLQITEWLRSQAANVIAVCEKSGSISSDENVSVKDDICARAVSLSGVKLLKDTDGEKSGKNEAYLEAQRVVRRSYDAVRDRVLQMYPWRFARKRAYVEVGAALPSDCLCVLSATIDGKPCDWEMVQGRLKCSGRAEVHYTARIADSQKWDAIFGEVFCYTLAEEIVTSTTGDTQTFQMLESKIQELAAKGYQLGVIQSLTLLTPEREIYRRAISLVHGQRTIQPATNGAYAGSLDTLGRLNDRAEAEYRACELSYETLRDKLLEVHAWTFARKSKEREANIPAIKGWRYGYKLPEDCLAVLTVIAEIEDEHKTSSLKGERFDPVEWEVSGKNLYANHEPVTIRYTAKDIPADEYPASFTEALVYLLACEVIRATQPSDEGTLGAIENLMSRSHMAIEESRQIGLIKEETLIPVRHKLCRRAMGLVRGLKKDNGADGMSNDELTVCLRNFNMVRDRVLQLYPWVFARRTTELQKAGEHLSGWRYKYLLPKDCLKVVAVVSRDVELLEYEVSGHELYTNSGCVSLRYTGLVADTHEWAAAFTDAFCVKLAREIAMSSSVDTKLIKMLDAQFEEIIQTAIETGIIKEETGLKKWRNSLGQPREYRRYLDYSGIPSVSYGYGSGRCRYESGTGELCHW